MIRHVTFSLSAYNKLTIKPIVKNFFEKIKAIFFLKKSFVYQFSIPTYLTESRLFLSMLKFHLSPCLTKALLARFSKVSVFKVSGRFKNDYIHETQHSWSVNINKTGPILAVYCV